MATARLIPPAPTKQGVELILTWEEAAILNSILQFVNCNGPGTPSALALTLRQGFTALRIPTGDNPWDGPHTLK